MTQEDPRRCGALACADGSVVWRVWAPGNRRVELVLYDGDRRRRSVAMQPEEGGYFRHAEPHVREGQRYAYRLDNTQERPDPCSAWQPDGVHRPSAVLFPARFPWTDQGWQGLERQD